MKTGSLLFVLLGLLPLILKAQTVLPATTFSAGQNVTVNGPATIATVSTAPVTVSSGAVVKFRATSSVTLGPGFTAAAGSSFRAFIFVDSDGDGMDDAWETSNGLNPNNPADAAGDLDGDGISNLKEYLLGTKPNVAKQTDSANATALKVQNPNRP